MLYPRTVAADPPVPVNFHDSPQLPVCRCVKVMDLGANRKGCPKLLMACSILALKKLRFTHASFKGGEKVGEGLGIVPDMGARAGTASLVIIGAFPSPEPAIILAQNSRRF